MSVLASGVYQNSPRDSMLKLGVTARRPADLDWEGSLPVLTQ